MGRIADNTKSIMPITWDALSGDSRVGDTALTARVNAAIIEVFGDSLTSTQEDALDDLVAEYVSKIAALEIIPTGIDYWMRQVTSVTTNPTQETETFTDPIGALRELKEKLMADVARLESRVEPLIPNIVADRGVSRPLISTVDDELLTPNPQDLGPIYGPATV